MIDRGDGGSFILGYPPPQFWVQNPGDTQQVFGHWGEPNPNVYFFIPGHWHILSWQRWPADGQQCTDPGTKHVCTPENGFWKDQCTITIHMSWMCLFHCWKHLPQCHQESFLLQGRVLSTGSGLKLQDQLWLSHWCGWPQCSPTQATLFLFL